MPLVRLRGVSKRFRVSHEKPALVRELLPRAAGASSIRERWALRDVDLEVDTGCSLGVLGPNGSGKTTLLSLLAGITAPTSGTVDVRGKVAPLLSLGSGFHPELTGLENIFLNGTLLGMSTREIRRKLEAIVAFSQLEEVIETPLQTYSTGMQLRLGFAVAVHSTFEILLIDELLAVGDLAFQRQCLERLRELRARGVLMVLVSQSPELLEELCDRAVLLEQGRLVAEGPPSLVASLYRHRSLEMPRAIDVMAEGPSEVVGQRLHLRTVRERQCGQAVQRALGTREGSGDIRLDGVSFLDADGRERERFRTGESWTARVRFHAREPAASAHLGVAIFRAGDGAYVYGPNTRFEGLEFSLRGQEAGDVRLTIEHLWLQAGSYVVSVAWWDRPEETEPGDDYATLTPHDYHVGCYRFEVVASAQTGGLCPMPYQIVARGAPSAEAAALRFVRTGEALEIAAAASGPSRRDPVRVRIVREDGLECFSARCWPWEGLRIPALLLLPGRYAVHLDDVPGQDLWVVSERHDHGSVYLPHRWAFTFDSPAARVEPQLVEWG